MIRQRKKILKFKLSALGDQHHNLLNSHFESQRNAERNFQQGIHQIFFQDS